MVPPPPHDRPRPSKHRSHRRVRAFPGVSSLSPPNVSVKNHPTTETKKTKNQTKAPRRMLEQFWFFVFLFFCFFGSLVFCFFGFLVFCFFWFFALLVVWFYCGEGYISKNPQNQKNQRTKKPKNQRTKEPKKQKTKKNKKPKNQKTNKPKNQKTKTVPAFSVELWFFGFLVSVVGWFFTDTFGGFKLDTPEKADRYLY